MRLPRKSLAVVGTVALALAVAPGAGHAATSAATPTNIGNYFPLTPTRVLDTRNGTGTGGVVAKLTTNKSLALQVAGQAGVPAAGVSAVVLNVTVTDTAAPSFLTVYPDGISRPNASNLNIVPGFIGANSVTVPLGSTGKIDIYNQNGSLDVVADVVGFYAATETAGTSGTGGQFFSVVPFRVVDTRNDASLRLSNGDYLTIPFDFGTGDSHIRAIAANITAVNPTANGFLTAFSGTLPVPNASTLNFTAHAIVPNLAIIPTSISTDPGSAGMPQIGVAFTGAGTVDVIIDVLGFYDDNTFSGGLHYHPVTPLRIVDTRSNLGITGRLGSGATATATISGGDSLTRAIAANVTGIGATGPTFIQLWPADATQPLTGSTLNLNTGDIKPNAALIGLDNSGGGMFKVYNRNATVDLAVDMSGIFDLLPVTPTGTASTQAAGPSAHLATPGAGPVRRNG